MKLCLSRAVLLSVSTFALAGCATLPPQDVVAAGKLEQELPAMAKGKKIESPAAQAMAARELECSPESVSVLDFDDHVRVSGCKHIAYFLKKSAKEWERVGPRFDLEPEDLPTASALPGFEPLTRISGQPPTLSKNQLHRVRDWESRVRAHCVLRVDGTLHQCFVVGTDEVVAETLASSLTTLRYQPVMVGGQPTPTPVFIVVWFKVNKPICANLSSPMLRFKCERATHD